ncbi:MAG: hypothetical protein LBI81_02545 [Puniceicoccales bacterium]|nr:hypothetical protein [Puniceicoccales bacterium]
MKKAYVALVVAFSLCGMYGFDESSLELDCAIQYESEHVNRGRPEMHQTIGGEARVGVGIGESWTAYVGVSTALAISPLSDVNNRSEVSPYVGISYAVSDSVTLDAGFSHHFYTGVKNREIAERQRAQQSKILMPYEDIKFAEMAKNSDEIYMGMKLDKPLSPSVYCYYDFGKQETAAEGKVSHIFNLSTVARGLSLKISGTLGCDRAKKMYALKTSISNYVFVTDLERIGGNWYGNLLLPKAKWYVYYDVGADLVYSMNNNMKFSAGVACAGNGTSKYDMCNAYTDGSSRKNATIFRASASCEF